MSDRTVRATPADPVVIRPVEPAEHQPVADLTVSVYAHVLGAVLSDPYRSELADVAVRAREAVVLVALEPAGRVVGSVTYVPGPGRYAGFEAADEAGIRMLVVAPDRRRMGIGTALVRACIELARAEGRARLSLHTTPVMADAHQLYDALGFRRAPERDQGAEPGVHLLGYVLEL